MGYNLWFGKYKGTSLEQIALGMSCPGGGGKSEGYYYFNQLGRGDKKYFGMFQNSSSAMNKWNEFHLKLNKFKSPYNCAVCKTKTPTRISIAGSGRWGYSMDRGYITCDDEHCQSAMASMPGSGTGLYPLGFDLILQFGWASRNRKGDAERLTGVLRDIMGWPDKQKLTENLATEFLDAVTLR